MIKTRQKSVAVLLVILFAMFTNSSLVVAGANFSWPLFMPAATGVGLCGAEDVERCRNEGDCLNYGGMWYNDVCHQSITCSDIAGCYTGNLSDSCPGNSVGGKVAFTINSDGSFSTITQYAVKANGTITNRSGNQFSGLVQTDTNGCGKFTINCTNHGTSISCNYQYANGKSGSISNGKPATCKPANQFLTETLAGSWRFDYKIGNILRTDNYVLD